MAAGLAALALAPAAAVAEPAREGADAVVARVGDNVITVREYAMTLRAEVRRRFYHARPPEAELAAFHREVADRMIDRRLALQEATRRGFKVDGEAVESQLQRLRRNSSHRDQHVDADAFWGAMRRQIEEQQLIDRLRAQVRQQVDGSDAAVARYFEAHPEKFTEPERVKVSVILLKVAPSAPQEAWDGALREAAQILGRIRKGARFEDLARLHSGDASGARGGDLGYLHRGMLGTTVETVIEALDVGGVSEPVSVLEGVALFRLVDRKAPHLNALEKVRDRARELMLMDAEAQAWDALIGRLRRSTPIRLEERYLVPS